MLVIKQRDWNRRGISTGSVCCFRRRTLLHSTPLEAETTLETIVRCLYNNVCWNSLAPVFLRSPPPKNQISFKYSIEHFDISLGRKYRAIFSTTWNRWIYFINDRTRYARDNIENFVQNFPNAPKTFHLSWRNEITLAIFGAGPCGFLERVSWRKGRSGTEVVFLIAFVLHFRETYCAFRSYHGPLTLSRFHETIHSSPSPRYKCIILAACNKFDTNNFIRW